MTMHAGAGRAGDLADAVAPPAAQYIDGEWVASRSSARSPVIDPAVARVWAEVAAGDERDVDAAVSAARAAFDAGRWPRMAPSERAVTMRRAADLLEASSDRLARTISVENGTPLQESTGASANAASILRYFASLADYLERGDVRLTPTGSHETLVRRDPIGVCALIAPWNFPINLVMGKLAAALIAGCTAVIKPASITPLSIRWVVAALAQAGVPAGVVNLVTGSGSLGDMLVRHPLVDKVAFTGSTQVGRHIAAICGELLRPVTLELGGKSSAIVMPDTDLEHLQRVLVRSCMRNTGQTCYIATRLLVPDSLHDAVVAAVTETLRDAPQGDPLDERTVFGPSASAAQRDTVLGYLQSASAAGARITLGGGVPRFDSPLSAGFFVQPTVLDEVTPDMRVAREEIFGPVITILRYRDLDDAVEMANATDFGLGGIVFGGDEDAALAVATRMDTGSVGINFFATNHAAPFGGRNDSGLGVEYGVEGLHAYLKYQSVHRGVSG